MLLIAQTDFNVTAAFLLV